MGEAICVSGLGLLVVGDVVYKTKKENFERLQHFRCSVPNVFFNRMVVGIPVVLIWK